jgi:hypothetical protein
VNALSGRAKQRYLSSFTEPERRGLRQLLLATRRHPEQWGGSHGAKARELAQELTVALWNRRGTEEDIFGGSTATPVEGQYQFRNSVYRRKLTQRDVDAILARVNTYADAIREGNRLGITKSELDGLVQHRYASEDQEYDTRRKVFADLYKRLHIPSTHNVFGDDHADKYWQKRKFDWEAYATEVLPTFGFDNIRYRPENPSYEDNAEYTDWAVNWLWDLYKGGPPRRKGTQAQRYKEALEEILHDHMQSKKVNKLVNNYQPTYADSGEEIPF